jgi:tetratricopeptide (TPR) repeat protein
MNKTGRFDFMTFAKAGLMLLVLALGGARAAAQQQLPEPKLTPHPSTEAQTAAVREGVALHERGDFDGAIRKYEAVLAENPANTTALYELGFSYYAKKEYRKALEVAYRGAGYQSNQLAGFYLLIGNNLDLAGEPDKAIEVYKKAIKLFPDDGLLHYNLALTYRNKGKLDEARKTLKVGLAAAPEHASSHLMLALIFHNGGYKVPALLAAARFLALEHSTQRSTAAVRLVRAVLGGGATAGNKPNEINLSLDLNSKKDEGDFTTIETVLGLSGALALTDKEKDKTEAQKLVGQMETVLAVLAEQGEKKQPPTFVRQFYVPYFVEMKQRGHVEAFVYHALKSSGLPGVREWTESNSGRVMQFLIWSKKYPWPADAKP